MIRFRCWYCNRWYAKAREQIGQRFTCNCKHTLKVPKRNGGSCRYRTPVDWLVQWLVCGGGGAFLGFLLALFLITQSPGRLFSNRMWMLLAGLPLAGLLIGLFGGERGIDWIGDRIREREQNYRD
jgi:hypothetical protein